MKNITLLIVFSILRFNGFLVTASIPKNTSLPPSSAGIGIKLSNPILIDRKPVKPKIAMNP